MPKPILSAEQCAARIQRLAVQIWEQNTEATHLVLLGIQGQGDVLAQSLAQVLQARKALPISVGKVILDKRAKVPTGITVQGIDNTLLQTCPVVLVDDVLNTGRVLSYAFAALLAYGPPKIQIAVLVARNHGLYPLAPDFVGHSISTTLEDHIEVRLDEGAFLQ